jgi:hypothetical protein
LARAIQTVLSSQPRVLFDLPLLSTAVPARAVDGTIVYSRASTALVQDFEGLLRTAKSGEIRFPGTRRVENLFTNSEVADTPFNTTINANAALDSEGRLVLDEIVENTSNGEHFAWDRNITAAVGERYLFHTEVKLGNTNSDRYFLLRVAGPVANVYVNVATGTIALSSGANLVSSGIVALGSGYYRVWVLANVTSAGTAIFRHQLTTTALAAIYTGDGLSSFFVGKAQIENVTGQSVQTIAEYVSNGVLAFPFHGSLVDGVKCFETTLAGARIPLDTLEGYLPESAATNLVIWSDTLDNAAWAKNAGATITANTVAGPTGAQTADTFTVVNTEVNILHNTTGITVTASTAYTFSFYTKLGTLAAADWKFAVYDVTNSAFIAQNIVLPTTPNSSTWTRQSYTFTTPATCTSLRVYPYRNQPATGGTVYLGGIQVELGSKATSHITTTSAAVTRAADKLNYLGVNVNPYKGTIGYTAKKLTAADATGIAIGFGKTATFNESVYSQLTTNSSSLSCVSAGVTQTNTTQSITVTNTNKVAISYKKDKVQHVANGGTVLEDTSVTLPTPVDLLSIGCSPWALDVQLNGTIKNIKVWNGNIIGSRLARLTQ